MRKKGTSTEQVTKIINEIIKRLSYESFSSKSQGSFLGNFGISTSLLFWR